MSQVTPLTTEYYEMLEAVYSSPYYTEDPSEACLFLPSIDLLNLQEQVLQNLIKELFMLIFSLLPPSTPLPTGQALLATAAVSQVKKWKGNVIK